MMCSCHRDLELNRVSGKVLQLYSGDVKFEYKARQNYGTLRSYWHYKFIKI